MAALTEIFARFRADVDTRQIRRGEKETKRFTDSLKRVGAAIGAAFAVDQIKTFTSTLIDEFTQIELTARRLGVTTDAVQELGFVAAGAGVDTNRLVDAFTTLQERARDAMLDPRSDPAEQLRALGVAATDAQGQLRSGEDLFRDVADGLSGLTSQTDRVGAAMTIFGDSGRDLLPVLQEGSAGIEEMRQAFRDLGGGASTQAIEAAFRTRDALDRFGVVVQTAKARLAEAFLPAIQEVTGVLTRSSAAWNKSTEGVDLLRIALLIATPVVAAFAVSMLAAAAPAIAIGAIITGVALAVDDLIVAYEGGESVIRDFFLAHFDYDINSYLDDLVDGWHQLGVEMQSLPDQVRVAFLSASGAIGRFSQSSLEALNSVLAAASRVVETLSQIPGAGALQMVAGAIGDLAGEAGSASGRAAAFAGRQERRAGQVSDRIVARRSAEFREAGVRERTREMQRTDVGRMVNPVGPPAPGAVTNNVAVTVNGAGDPDAVARRVADHISRDLTAANEGR